MLQAAYHVEGYAHASRERFGVMAGSLLGHEAGSSLHQTAGCPANAGKDYRERDLLDQVAYLIEIFGIAGAAQIVGCP